jgi:glycosyltransferase involved in cell wall biosynthesis
VRERKNISLVQCGGTSPVRFFSYWQIFKKCRPDTVLFIKGCLDVFPWYAFFAARLCGAERVLAIEHLLADSPGSVTGLGLLNGLRRMVGHYARERWKMKLADVLCHKTITVSDAVREKLIREYGYSAEKTVTVRNGVDLRRYRRLNVPGALNLKRELGCAVSDPIILCIANLNPQKRIDVLLRAVHIVSRNHQRVRCVILGRGTLEAKLRSLADDLEVADRVVFAGHVGDVRPYLEVAELLVLSSDKEGLPLCLGEAMAYGIPCVATDVGGNKEIIVHGQTGLLVKPGSPEPLAEAIEYLLAHSDERSRMGAQGLARVQAYFDSEQAMATLQRELLGESRPVGVGSCE